MASTKPSREVPMFPRMVQMKIRIIFTGIMAYPVIAIDVRRIRMPGLIAEVVVVRGPWCSMKRRGAACRRRMRGRSTVSMVSTAAMVATSTLTHAERRKR